MSYTKILLHCVWTTKNRMPLINKKAIPQFIKHIIENAEQKEIYIDIINMVEDHAHCLISLGKNQNIANVMELIKGESSYWYNKQGFGNKLYWQDDYFSVSIGQSQLDSVRKYIYNQQEHHRKKTFQQEYDEFMLAYGFNVKGDKSPEGRGGHQLRQLKQTAINWELINAKSIAVRFICAELIAVSFN